MFVVIIIALVIATMARLAVTQNSTNSMAILQARAYQAARAGLEYGIAQKMAGAACANFQLDGFAIGVACIPQAAGVIPEENNKSVQFYTITATAEYGSAGSPDYAYRQLTAMVEQ